jgi:hypothetical protein
MPLNPSGIFSIRVATGYFAGLAIDEGAQKVSEQLME